MYYKKKITGKSMFQCQELPIQIFVVVVVIVVALALIHVSL